MSKTLITIENHLIDIYVIKHIEMSEEWDESEESTKYTILINNPKNIKVDTFTPSFKFRYDTEPMRDAAHQDLRDRLEEQQVVII